MLTTPINIPSLNHADLTFIVIGSNTINQKRYSSSMREMYRFMTPPCFSVGNVLSFLNNKYAEIIKNSGTAKRSHGYRISGKSPVWIATTISERMIFVKSSMS